MTLPDITFFLAAIPAVTVVGLSKGGMGGAMGLMGVPLLALAVPPVQAAAIFLPILIMMDLVALWAWRSHNHRETLLVCLPGAVIGIALGWATSAYVSTNIMRLVIGAITIVFALKFFYDTYGPKRHVEVKPKEQRPVLATLWMTLSGYGSFVAHAGGPPFQIYVLPLKLDPKTYTGTSVRYFAIVNAIKVLPYFALGELDTENLSLSVLLLPVAFVSTMIGAWAVRHMKPQFFYPFMYVMVLIAATKLFYDGLQW